MATLFLQRNGELSTTGCIESSGLPILIHEDQQDLDSLMVLIGSLDRSGSGKYYLNRLQVDDLDPYGGSYFNFGDLLGVQDYCNEKLDLIKSNRS